MRTVLKYELPLEAKFDLIVPRQSIPLKVELQNGLPFVWMLCESGAEEEVRHFRIYGTGHKISEDTLAYYGTVQIQGFVWHIFEIKEKPPTPLNVA